MTPTATFELTCIGGPWSRRLARRRLWLDELAPIDAQHLADDERESLRAVWTRTAFSEYASACAFADIAAHLLAANAPIDLVAAAGEFVVDEVVHCEASARVATCLGGAVPLAVDMTRLVRPATGDHALLRAASLVVRTSCVGEALTVPILKLGRRVAGNEVVAEVLRRIVTDEAHHAQLGWWFLDWAAPRLDDDALARLGMEAGRALCAFAPVLACDGDRVLEGFGAIACADYEPAFTRAVQERVVAPLAARGITVPAADLEAVHASS